MPLAYDEGARRGRVSAGVRIGWPERRGSVVRREMHARRGRGVGAHAAAAAGEVTTRARRAVCARVENGRREEVRRRCRPSNTGRRGLCGLGALCRQGCRGSRRPLGDGWLSCGAAVVGACNVWARVSARVEGGARLAIVRRDATTVVIVRAR